MASLLSEEQSSYSDLSQHRQLGEQTLATSSTDTLVSEARPEAHRSLTRDRLAQTERDIRRLSVQSILSGPSETRGTRRPSGPSDVVSTTQYGFDQGRPDLDVPGNDDANALRVLRQSLSKPDGASPAGNLTTLPIIPSPGAAFHSPLENYYLEPIPVSIPRALEPLPPLLVEQPMNLLYFHHFLNHTARTLLPYDCRDNPFRTVFPQSLYPEWPWLCATADTSF